VGGDARITPTHCIFSVSPCLRVVLFAVVSVPSGASLRKLRPQNRKRRQSRGAMIVVREGHASGTAHPIQRTMRLEPAFGEPSNERLPRVERVHHDRSSACRTKRGADENPCGVVIVGDNRSDLIEKTSWSADAVTRGSARLRGRVRVVGGLVDHPFHQGGSFASEDSRVAFDDRREVIMRERTNIALTLDRDWWHRASQFESIRNVPRQHRLILEPIALIELATERRCIESDRQVGWQHSDSRLEQPSPDALSTEFRLDQHHGNPSERAVVDADGGTNYSIVDKRRETAGRRQLQEHAPVVEPLIPAGG
jgi:hypothetical protein